MKLFTSVLLSALVSLSTSNALAMVEVKLELGALVAKADSFAEAIRTNVANNPNFSAVGNAGVDAVYISDQAIVTGVRAEAFAASQEGTVTYQSAAATTKNQLSGTRVSVVAGYRFTQSPKFHLGVLGHYAVNSSMDYEQKIDATSYKYTGKVDPSYGGGIDLGVHFGRFMMGSEIGYTLLKAKFTGTAGPLNGLGEQTADLSGGYFKFTIGAGF
jgi:hypothetical protein